MPQVAAVNPTEQAIKQPTA